MPEQYDATHPLASRDIPRLNGNARPLSESSDISTVERIAAKFNTPLCARCGVPHGVHGFGVNPATDPHMWEKS